MEKLMAFRKLGLSEETLEVLEKKGFEEPTPIQSAAIPVLLTTSLDVIGQAQTGTGKTAAFALPIIEKIDEDNKQVQALILAPTRELAVQVSDECNSLKGSHRLKIIPVYGGQAIQEQIRHLKKGVQIVVGTPGRILDHLRRRTLKLKSLSFIVLDEADEMLNMGFIDEVDEIMAQCNEDRQVALFSATMPEKIESLAKKYMKETRRVSVKKQEATANLTDQIYFEVRHQDKFEALCRIIDVEDVFYGLVFCRTKNDVDETTLKLGERGYDAAAIHGDITQKQREQVLAKFKSKMVNILVATDVAARGLDISNLTHVINFALPHDPEAYVHRIGRTGRAGQRGVAITFITPSEYRKLVFIQRVTKSDIRKEQIPEVSEIIKIKHAQVGEEIEESMGEEGLEVHQQMAHSLMSKHSPEQLVTALLRLIMQDRIDESRYQKISVLSSPDSQGKTRLLIGKGMRDGFRPKQLVDFIKKQTGLKDHLIDDVAVQENFSFITVPFRDAERIVKHFEKSTQKGGRPLVTKAENKGKSSRSAGGSKNYAKPKRYDKSERYAKPKRDDKAKRYDKPKQDDRPKHYARSKQADKPGRDDKPWQDTFSKKDKNIKTEIKPKKDKKQKKDKKNKNKGKRKTEKKYK
ncbi:DEAD/DEAH box helicase [bacterium]|nr:DEAD/DEAH box helicase [bacterium]